MIGVLLSCRRKRFLILDQVVVDSIPVTPTRAADAAGADKLRCRVRALALLPALLKICACSCDGVSLFPIGDAGVRDGGASDDSGILPTDGGHSEDAGTMPDAGVVDPSDAGIGC